MNDQAAGLMLSGGGTRAAYQVGVLRAIANVPPRRSLNPFGIICGTFAGAINAASLASNADRFDRAAAQLTRTAVSCADELPRAMRLLVRRAGVFGPGGARVFSSLLFKRSYCRHLMRLGFSDAMVQRPRILEFLGYDSVLAAKRRHKRATA